MQDDGVGLGQGPPVGELHGRDLAGGIEGQERRRTGGPGHDVDLDPLVGEAQPVGGPLDLQAIARAPVPVDA